MVFDALSEIQRAWRRLKRLLKWPNKTADGHTNWPFQQRPSQVLRQARVDDVTQVFKRCVRFDKPCSDMYEHLAKGGSDMKLHKLQELVRKHNLIPFPKHPEDDALSDWVDELAEVDGFFLGIASSTLHSGTWENLNVDCFYRMENELNSIVVDLDEDKIILDSCFAYMESLRNIINELKTINSQSH